MKRNKRMQKVLLIGIIAFFAVLLYPLTLGIFCAYFLFPSASFMHEKLKLPKFFAIFIILLFFILSISILSLAIISVFYIQLKDLYEVVSKIHLTTPTLQYLEQLFIQEIMKMQLLIPTYATKLPSIILELVVFIFTIFFSMYESFRNKFWFFSILPASIKKEALLLFRKSTSIFSMFLKVEIQLLLFTFFYLAILFSFLPLQHPIQLSFIIMLTDLIPFLGTGIIMLPLSAYFFLTNNQTIGIVVILIYIGLILFRQLLENSLWANSISTRPIVPFFIGTASILIFGLYGIVISPFLLALYFHLKKINAL